MRYVVHHSSSDVINDNIIINDITIVMVTIPIWYTHLSGWGSASNTDL